MLRECVLLVSMCVLGGGSISGRGFFCRDPDTGKLHPINSTWPSSSFCGKYHCRLRRKNITEIEYAPARELNVTNIKLFSKNFSTGEVLNEKVFYSKDKVQENDVTKDKKIDLETVDKTRVPNIIHIGQNIGLQIEERIANDNESDRDRYLTETEIKSISDILHTVKKSDLDAIVEIYNLAQDIYKEIDHSSTDSVPDNPSNTTKNLNNYPTKSTDMQKTAKLKNRVSYWYEPLANGKLRPVDLLRNDMTRSELMRNDIIPVIPAIPADMDVQGSNIINVAQPTTTKPKIVPTLVTLAQSGSGIRRMTASYFNGPLSHKDFGKLPYYYPISNFQRSSSYTHQQPKKPEVKPAFRSATYNTQINNGGVYQKEIKPSILLPYPFSYVHHYNWSYPQNAVGSKNRVEQQNVVAEQPNVLVQQPNIQVEQPNVRIEQPNVRIEQPNVRVEQLNVRTEYQTGRLELPIVRTKENVKIENINYMQKTRKAVLMNPDLENFQDLEVKAMRDIEDKTPLRTLMNKVNEEKRRPDWQTDQIPNQILEEVRAHVQEKQRLIKPFHLRKKVKVERVGKLIKLDELSRSRRSAAINTDSSDDVALEPELYEVYIERTTCNSDYSVPGFFRYGNLSQPFPDCCPQRIARR